jgi:hypothetical protein
VVRSCGELQRGETTKELPNHGGMVILDRGNSRNTLKWTSLLARPTNPAVGPYHRLENSQDATQPSVWELGSAGTLPWRALFLGEGAQVSSLDRSPLNIVAMIRDPQRSVRKPGSRNLNYHAISPEIIKENKWVKKWLTR